MERNGIAIGAFSVMFIEFWENVLLHYRLYFTVNCRWGVTYNAQSNA